MAACEAAGTKVASIKVKREETLRRKGKLGVTKKNHFNISHIVEEVKSSGKAKAWFLIEWEGYHPTWEHERINGHVGDPIQAWMSLAEVRNSQAFYAWRGIPLPS